MGRSSNSASHTSPVTDPRKVLRSTGPMRDTKSDTKPAAPPPEGPAGAVPGRSKKAKVAR